MSECNSLKWLDWLGCQREESLKAIIFPVRVQRELVGSLQVKNDWGGGVEGAGMCHCCFSSAH